MYKNVPADAFFDSMPVYISPYDIRQMTESKDFLVKDNLEEDVRVEEEYLGYLFRYTKDIKHIKN